MPGANVVSPWLALRGMVSATFSARRAQEGGGGTE